MISKDLALLLGTGLLGGLTTMSAFSVETFQMIELVWELCYFFDLQQFQDKIDF